MRARSTMLVAVACSAWCASALCSCTEANPDYRGGGAGDGGGLVDATGGPPVTPPDFARGTVVDLAVSTACTPACAPGSCCASGGCTGSGFAPNAGEVCVDGTVLTCGGTGQPCCALDRCDSGCCSANVCVAVGGRCLASNDTCNANGSCGQCGALGQQCCQGAPDNGSASDYCTAPGAGCDNGMCSACGGAGQPCCAAGLCFKNGCCDGNNHCVAENGMCPGGQGTCLQHGCMSGTCGRAGQPPCGPEGCTAPLTDHMRGSLCHHCGELNEDCCPWSNGDYCAPPYACDGNTHSCLACGGDNQPCCAGSYCPNSPMHACGGNDRCH